MKRILVVEDNPADMYLIQEALNTAGVTDYHLDYAEDGEQALDYFTNLPASGKPDLVVLDLNLPKSGGTDVLRAIRTSPELSGTVVVTWTSSVLPNERDQLQKLGVDEHIVKPMRLEEYTEVGTLLRKLLAGA